MRAVIQRVTYASVTIEGKKTASIGKGYLVLLGCENADTEEDIDWLSKKICNLRVFDWSSASSPYGQVTRKAIVHRI